jgi:predicted RNA-binding Zn-ribbon protein involved in translation (DUF1610 family)
LLKIKHDFYYFYYPTWDIFKCIKINSIPMTPELGSGMVPTTMPGAGKRVPLRVKLVFILLLLLVMSSGAVIYVETPLFYYGVVALGLVIVVVLVYFAYFLARGKPELFADSEGDLNGNATDSGTGLRMVLEAEKDYKTRISKRRRIGKPGQIRKTDRMKVKKELTKTETDAEIEPEKEQKLGKKQKTMKMTGRKTMTRRIGTISLEDSMMEKRYKLSGDKGQKKKTKKESKVTTFLCPECGSKELYYEAGLISGYKYHCKDCDYLGSFVIEKDFEV